MQDEVLQIIREKIKENPGIEERKLISLLISKKFNLQEGLIPSDLTKEAEEYRKELQRGLADLVMGYKVVTCLDNKFYPKTSLEFDVAALGNRILKEIVLEKEKMLISEIEIPEDIKKEVLKYLENSNLCYVENGYIIKGKKAEFRVYNGEEFMKLDIPEPDFQIQGYAIEKGITILGGYQSVFKTHTAAYIALCVSNGKKLFGKFDCKKGNVWYINEELNEGSFQKLLERLSSGNSLDIGKNFYVSSFQSLKIDTEEDNKKYMNFIKEKKINLVIFDTFRECFVSKENSADEINLVLHEFIRPIIEETGSGFLIIMHKGKATQDNRQAADLLRGSSVFRNYVDSIILIDRVRKSERIEIVHEKIRGTKEQGNLNITWQFGDDSIRPLIMTEEELEKIMIDDLKKELIEYLNKIEEEEFETGAKSKIYEKFVASKKYSNGTFYAAMRELKEEGKIRQIKRGSYRYKEATLNEF